MTIAEVLQGVPTKRALPAELACLPVSGLDCDSRKIQPGWLFFAFLGQLHDARKFAPAALANGALAVICETPKPDYVDGPWIEVEHGRHALALAARNFYAGALANLRLTGITGTNGKTTTAYLVDSMFRASGATTAMIGTVEYLLGGVPRKSENTTPESLDVYRILAELAQMGGTCATMEVSSHALNQGRVYGVPFHTAVFTNLTRDHLDYHGSMEEYFDAKKRFFDGRETPAPRYAILNRDDLWSEKIPVDAGTNVLWYGFDGRADIRASRVTADFDGVRFRAEWSGVKLDVRSTLLGKMNVYNILAAAGAGISYGLSSDEILRGIDGCTAVPGRFERIIEGQPFLVVVDYAHTHDALRNVIAAARDLSPRRVITVFGCGGDRDRTKRPLMGQVAGEGSDFVVLTSDNPRTEDPLAIINDALVGLRRQDVAHKIEVDRTAAIKAALSEANAGDIVLIAGKGHETYQVLKDGKIDFDDRQVARGILRGFGFSGGNA